MARQRSGLGGLWLPLTLQAAVMVASAHTTAVAETHYAQLLAAPADDAFVFAASAQASPVEALAAEELLLQELLLPPIAHAPLDYGALALEYAPVAPPEPFFDFHHDDFFFA